MQSQKPVSDADTATFVNLCAFFFALLGLFSVQQAVIFNEDIPNFRQGLALINALAFSAVTLVQTRRAVTEEKPPPLLYPAIGRSLALAALFAVLQSAEEATLALSRGAAPAQAVPTFGDGSLQAILITAALLFVALIPFFMLIEMRRVIPPGELRAHLFGRRTQESSGDEHIERHFLNSQTVRDVVIGMADGLTVPFALAAGISAAIASTRVVVTAGLAEIVAGAIAMGLGGYLAARSEQEHFASEEKREYLEVEKVPERERGELREIFSEYGLKDAELDSVVGALSADKRRWVDFMMRFELGLEKPDPKRAPVSAATIASAYFIGGLIPLAPYMIETDIRRALVYSAVFTGLALVIFGAAKGKMTGSNPFKSGFQTLLVGGLAAGAAYYLASLFGE